MEEEATHMPFYWRHELWAFVCLTYSSFWGYYFCYPTLSLYNALFLSLFKHNLTIFLLHGCMLECIYIPIYIEHMLAIIYECKKGYVQHSHVNRTRHLCVTCSCELKKGYMSKKHNVCIIHTPFLPLKHLNNIAILSDLKYI